MNVHHTAIARVETTDRYDCARCGYAGEGWVRVRGTGSAQTGGALFGNDRAAEIARDTAEADAWSKALSRVALAACPRCGARDRAAWAGWLRGKLFVPITASLAAAALAGVLYLGIVDADGGTGAMITAIAAAIVTYAAALAAVVALEARATQQVQFRERPPDGSSGQADGAPRVRT